MSVRRKASRRKEFTQVGGVRHCLHINPSVKSYEAQYYGLLKLTWTVGKVSNPKVQFR
jgi:hypothetical protein